LKTRQNKGKRLFSWASGKAVYARQVQALLKLKLASLGMQASAWESGISLRRGGATTLALCGVPDRVIQAFGRWKSFSYRLYVDLSPIEKESWTNVVKRKLLGRHFDDAATAAAQAAVQLLAY
jgi:hypothetical protein